MGRLLLRLLVGGFFVGHGTQKLFGWFGGGGPDGTAQFFEKLGLRPGRRHALAAGAAEAGGGVLIAAGLATPFAAAGLIATMLTAIRTVHWEKGPWVASGGYEYNAVLIAALATLVEVGPGELSLDSALRIERTGNGWTLAAVAAGTLGSLAATATVADAPAETPAERAG
jgi:putative oxidoreductase